MAMSNLYVRGICLGLGLGVVGTAPSVGMDMQGKLSPSELERRKAADCMYRAQRGIEAFDYLDYNEDFIKRMLSIVNNKDLSVDQKLNEICPLIYQTLQRKSALYVAEYITTYVRTIMTQNPQIKAITLLEELHSRLTQEIEHYQAMLPHNQ